MKLDDTGFCLSDGKSVECHLHALMCSVFVVTVVFIHTMEDDQRLNTLVHEGDTLHFSLLRNKNMDNRCSILLKINLQKHF